MAISAIALGARFLHLSGSERIIFGSSCGGGGKVSSNSHGSHFEKEIRSNTSKARPARIFETM